MILLSDHASGSVVVGVADGAMTVTMAAPIPGNQTFDSDQITFDTTSHTFDEEA